MTPTSVVAQELGEHDGRQTGLIVTKSEVDGPDVGADCLRRDGRSSTGERQCDELSCGETAGGGGSTASGCSCCTQWPAPSDQVRALHLRRQRLLQALDAHPGSDTTPQSLLPPMKSDGTSIVRPEKS